MWRTSCTTCRGTRSVHLHGRGPQGEAATVGYVAVGVPLLATELGVADASLDAKALSSLLAQSLAAQEKRNEEDRVKAKQAQMQAEGRRRRRPVPLDAKLLVFGWSEEEEEEEEEAEASQGLLSSILSLVSPAGTCTCVSLRGSSGGDSRLCVRVSRTLVRQHWWVRVRQATNSPFWVSGCQWISCQLSPDTRVPRFLGGVKWVVTEVARSVKHQGQYGSCQAFSFAKGWNRSCSDFGWIPRGFLCSLSTSVMPFTCTYGCCG